MFRHLNGELTFSGSRETSRERIKFTTQNLRRSLTQLIKKAEDSELKDVPTIKIDSDTLIVALGSDITATVNATIAHRKTTKLKM